MSTNSQSPRSNRDLGTGAAAQAFRYPIRSQRSEGACPIGPIKSFPTASKTRSRATRKTSIARLSIMRGARRGNESLEEVAHRVAWAAVKKKYEKVGEEWQPKD